VSAIGTAELSAPGVREFKKELCHTQCYIRQFTSAFATMPHPRAVFRLAHLTDLHFRGTPSLRELTLKRVFGLINQHALGRKNEFHVEVQLAAIAAVRALRPDALCVSGDLTAMALESEFRAARDALLPLLVERPSLVIPGNHDAYTRAAVESGLLQRHFGDFMRGNCAQQGSQLPILSVGPLDLIGMNPCRPILLESTGLFPGEQLSQLSALLSPSSSLSPDSAVVIATHYPVLDRSGAPYHVMHPKHGVRNGQAFIDTVTGAAAGNMILHGHDHHGFHQKLGM
jgi:3',5'-cyclic AMP phosphodiesterase CpdA